MEEYRCKDCGSVNVEKMFPMNDKVDDLIARVRHLETIAIIHKFTEDEVKNRGA